MSAAPTILLGGVPESVSASLESRLLGVRIAQVRTSVALMESLSTNRVSLLVVADGFDGKRAADVYGEISTAARKPEKTWCCLAGLGTAEQVASLVASDVNRIFFLPLNIDEVVREAARLLGVEVVEPGVPASSEKNTVALAKVWERFRDSTLARVGTLEAAVLNLLQDTLSDEERAAAEREAHKLAGSAGTFGFPRSSRIAKEIEQRFSNSGLESSDSVDLSEQVIALRKDLEGAPQTLQSVASEPGANVERRLLVLSGDAEFMAALRMEGEGRGFAMSSAADIASARAAVQHDRPALALVDIPVQDDRDYTLEFIEELTSAVPCIPVIALSAAKDFQARLEASRRGADVFLETPISTRRTFAEVVSAFERLSGPRASILALDDDPQILSAIRALLEPARMNVITLDNPLGLADMLDDSQPDLLLLDIDMPFVSGFELCRALRQDSRWARLPILIVTGRDDAASIQRAFSAGADDFIRKPIIPAELLMRINSRLERARLNRELGEVDPATGIANQRKAGELMERFLRLAARRRDSFCLALLDAGSPEGADLENDRTSAGPELRAIGRTLIRSLRAEDIVGRWTGGRFIVGFFGTSKSDAANRLRTILEQFSNERSAVTGAELSGAVFRGGVAQFPQDGADLDALCRAAEGALRMSSRSGMENIVVAGSAIHAGTQRVDVVVIDDDEAIVGLLTHSLENQGLSYVAFSSGDRAVAALTGPIPEVFASAILLDVDLPGMNGLDVMRVLAREKVIEKTKVVMLSARSGEADILSALEMGATDHVTKPFSVPVLMQKLKSVLRSNTV